MVLLHLLNILLLLTLALCSGKCNEMDIKH